MENQEEKLEEIFSYYEACRDRGSQEQVIALLRELQELYGYIPEELTERMETQLGVKRSVTHCIIRMVSDLKECPYRHVVTVCTGERCGKKQGAEILAAVREALDIRKDGMSGDGTVCLKTRNCLKSCASSPNMLVDQTLHQNLTPKEAAEIVKALK